MSPHESRRDATRESRNPSLTQPSQAHLTTPNSPSTPPIRESRANNATVDGQPDQGCIHCGPIDQDPLQLPAECHCGALDQHDQASRPVVPVGPCGVPDEAVQAAAVAICVAVAVGGPCFAQEAHVEQARAALAAAVPHVREAIAREIEAYRSERFAEYGNEETGPRNYDWALTRAADIARVVSS